MYIGFCLVQSVQLPDLVNIGFNLVQSVQLQDLVYIGFSLVECSAQRPSVHRV